MSIWNYKYWNYFIFLWGVYEIDAIHAVMQATSEYKSSIYLLFCFFLFFFVFFLFHQLQLIMYSFDFSYKIKKVKKWKKKNQTQENLNGKRICIHNVEYNFI